MAQEKQKGTQGKKDPASLKLKPEHAESTLIHKGQEICLANASEEVLNELYNDEFFDWKYLFEIEKK